MAGIETYLERIKNAVYGREVRQAIYDGIHQCYEDGKAGAVDLVAREEIAQLIAPSGEAPSAAEVTDARVGADGVTYQSLGVANRTQFNNIKTGLEYTSRNRRGSLNAFDYAFERLEGKYVSYQNGIVNNAANYVAYHYIPVKPNERYWLATFRSPAHVCYHDEAGKYISGEAHVESNSVDHIITIPAGCYLLSVSYGEINMLNLGEKPATLIPIEYYYGEQTPFDLEYGDKKLYSEALVSTRNVLDRMAGYINNYYSYVNGRLFALAHYCAIEIPTKPNTQYCSLNPRMHIAFMDGSGNYISGIYDAQARSFTTPSNCYSMRIGYRYEENDGTTPVYIAICPNQSSGAMYSEFGDGDIYEIKSIMPKTLTVGVGQQYQTIGDAISAAVDGDTILVYAGVYNETLNAYSKKIHIVGVSKEHCILKYSADVYQTPPLHMAKGSVENMTIYAYWNGDTSNMRAYCVHIDSNELRDETLSFENVNFISERGATVGIGTRTNCHLKFHNCTFHTTKTAVEGAIYNHDSESEAEGSGGYAVYENQNVEYVDCLIINESTDYSIKLQSQERLDKCCNITFINNKVIQPNNDGKTISMTLWQGRTLTNDNYLGSSDFVLTEISGLNSEAILDYSA